MNKFFGVLTKKQKTIILITIVAAFFLPFPTEMVPKWEMQIVDEKNQPLANVRTEQSWENYTFFAVRGYDKQCTDSEGKVTFPTRYLWAGSLSRIVSPQLANIMTLAHGSTGTDAHIRVVDPNHSSDFIYWREKEKIYTRIREPLPKQIVAEKRKFDNYKGC